MRSGNALDENRRAGLERVATEVRQRREAAGPGA
jgi:hypothetical protein